MDATFHPGLHLAVGICIRECKNKNKSCSACIYFCNYEPVNEKEASCPGKSERRPQKVSQ